MKRFKVLIIVVIISLVTVFSAFKIDDKKQDKKDKDYIKWVDCNVSYEVMKKAYEYDLEFHNQKDVDFSFIKALAYLATKNGNKFNVAVDLKNLDELVRKLREGKKIDDFYGGNKYYKYYVEAYDAIFMEFIGEYKEHGSHQIKYGLKNYHPFPKGFWYNHSDDFGVGRNYGFKRRHLGHDMFGSIGTPIIAIEGGTVTELGWNRYGGWRIGIRSFDKKRSYYYAHMRKDRPYIKGLKKGDKITAGQVIGYLGVTGYSMKENVNMNTKPHLHLGMQLIFDESQVQGMNEIWIDMYQISKFLSLNRAEVKKFDDDYKSVNIKRAI
ncbi:MAG: M23 family metallopeptidase [Bacillota bacterium]|jgi:murein DD-endopeptidase MepM/ murein hydrolase activator NlpD|nr:M23 family metallopeptidase [Bacillota bacterium]HHU43096.1 M23 family metallopeptidase [Clostridiales bacterium]